MMNIQVKLTAEEARANSKKLRRTPNKAVPAPVLDKDLNPLLEDTPDDSPNQLHSKYHGQSLAINIPEFDQDSAPGVRGFVYLRWNGVRTGTRYPFTSPIAAGDFPLPMTLPDTATVNAGTHQLSFEVNTGGNPTFSESLSISIDRTPPNGGNAGALIELPAEVELSGITAEYLAANGDKVVVTVPLGYGDARIGDEIIVYLGDTIPTALKVGTVVRADVTTPITVELTKAMLEGREGDQTLFYTLADRKGNVGRQSAFKNVNITLAPAPAGLQPPKVPVGADGLIDQADAIQGVVVEIDPYTNWSASDQVVVAFDGVDQPAQAMPQAGAVVALPYSAVLNGNPGLKDSRVTYKIVRGNREFPETVGFDVKVDLRTPGPVDPTDPPGVVHPLLALPVVKGAVSPNPDELTEADAGQPATASVDLYGLSKAGDIVQLYWNGKPVPAPDGEYRVVGTEPPTFKIPFTIPWELIDTEGNSDALPVHYTVAHPATNGNIITSGAKPVRVRVSQITVPKPEFLNPDEDFGSDWFNCGSLRQNQAGVWGMFIQVPGGEPKLANQELAFTYQGWADAAGTTPVPGNEYKFTFTPTIEEANNGFVVHVPYDPWFLTTDLRYGSIVYEAEINGFPVLGKSIVVTFWMSSAGQTCKFA
ncbi:hypothetical protein [Pseudomonas sp. BBP2017]|uniref:hypothetical protein n=1 Tax=Pseudomonas sp. BBP2017 TaxID=2109731 RepID=UPI000D134300|nr:hypothetical protein [Pseudomonas sp. BBP2017]PSS46714.1 hypothetical protein C6382_22685 [Pseudomonas sp. BBP2017]